MNEVFRSIEPKSRPLLAYALVCMSAMTTHDISRNIATSPGDENPKGPPVKLAVRREYEHGQVTTNGA